VDSSHPRIKSGDVDETPEQLFANNFTQSIIDILAEKPSISFLVVPSINDTLSEHASFPQSKFDASLLCHNVRVDCIPPFVVADIQVVACSLP
jgi:DNA polymerase alpha subunit B